MVKMIRTRSLPGRLQAQRGGTLTGLLIGVVTGLAVAVVVAVVVSRSPVPFLKSQRTSDRIGEARTGVVAPDPNAGLRSRVRDADSPAPPVVASVPAPTAPGALAPALPPPAAPEQPADAGYLLQAGAFRSADDAEAMKARLALIGIEARVVVAEVGGQTMFRVRIGPFAGQEEAGRARARLAENGVDSALIRQR
jgi:cell division protein FtsN